MNYDSELRYWYPAINVFFITAASVALLKNNGRALWMLVAVSTRKIK